MSHFRVGMWSATSAAAIKVIYVVAGLNGVVTGSAGSDPLRQVGPYLVILEALIMLYAAVLVIMPDAVLAYPPPERETSSLAALAFIVCSAILTALGALRSSNFSLSKFTGDDCLAAANF